MVPLITYYLSFSLSLSLSLSSLLKVEKLVEAASIQSVKQWRRLPHIVSHSHIPLLQLSQQIIELQEATQIHTGMQSGSLNRQPFINEVKTIFKTWK